MQIEEILSDVLGADMEAGLYDENLRELVYQIMAFLSAISTIQAHAKLGDTNTDPLADNGYGADTEPRHGYILGVSLFSDGDLASGLEVFLQHAGTRSKLTLAFASSTTRRSPTWDIVEGSDPTKCERELRALMSKKGSADDILVMAEYFAGLLDRISHDPGAEDESADTGDTDNWYE